MTDRREQINARLVEIAKGIDGIDAHRVFRNQVDVTGPARAGTAVVVWDGDEAAIVDAKGTWTRIVEMTPDVRVVAGEKAADIGAVLNAARLSLIKAVLGDSALKVIIGANGDRRYNGCGTGIERGQKVEGELTVQFAFRYPLIISEL